MKKQQAGFTLIELVLVIVILGILAATALPRFSDLSNEARAASLKGLAGGVRSAAALAKATQLARNGTANASISMEDQTVTMSNRYPEANSTGITRALSDVSGFTDDGSGTFTLISGCTVQYQNGGAGSFTVTITSTAGTCL
jgi:MSHA pilin protein MshA